MTGRSFLFIAISWVLGHALLGLYNENIFLIESFNPQFTGTTLWSNPLAAFSITADIMGFIINLFTWNYPKGAHPWADVFNLLLVAHSFYLLGFIILEILPKIAQVGQGATPKAQ